MKKILFLILVIMNINAFAECNLTYRLNNSSVLHNEIFDNKLLASERVQDLIINEDVESFSLKNTSGLSSVDNSIRYGQSGINFGNNIDRVSSGGTEGGNN